AGDAALRLRARAARGVVRGRTAATGGGRHGPVGTGARERAGGGRVARGGAARDRVADRAARAGGHGGLGPGGRGLVAEGGAGAWVVLTLRRALLRASCAAIPAAFVGGPAAGVPPAVRPASEPS